MRERIREGRSSSIRRQTSLQPLQDPHSLATRGIGSEEARLAIYNRFLAMNVLGTLEEDGERSPGRHFNGRHVNEWDISGEILPPAVQQVTDAAETLPSQSSSSSAPQSSTVASTILQRNETAVLEQPQPQQVSAVQDGHDAELIRVRIIEDIPASAAETSSDEQDQTAAASSTSPVVRRPAVPRNQRRLAQRHSQSQQLAQQAESAAPSASAESTSRGFDTIMSDGTLVTMEDPSMYARISSTPQGLLEDVAELGRNPGLLEATDSRSSEPTEVEEGQDVDEQPPHQARESNATPRSRQACPASSDDRQDVASSKTGEGCSAADQHCDEPEDVAMVDRSL